MPKISIIVPIYNVEKYLAKCLDSLINQTFSDIEIICVDDGSSDNSFTILSSYAAQDKRIVVYKNINSGVSVTRNKGLDLASSPYIMFCDSDDYYEPNMCELMFKAIDENDVDLGSCGYDEVYSDGSIKTYEFLSDGISYFSHDKMEKIPVVVWCKIFRKAIIDKYNLRFPIGLWYEDIAFFYIYSAVSNNFFHINKSLYKYIQRDNSIMENSRKKTIKSLEHIDILEFIYCFYTLNNIFIINRDKYFKLLILLFTNMLYYMPSDKYSLAYEKTQSFLNTIPKQYFIDLDKNTTKKIEYIKHNKDPRVLIDKVKLFNLEVFRIEETDKRKRFYLFNIKVFSVKKSKK